MTVKLSWQQPQELHPAVLAVHPLPSKGVEDELEEEEQADGN